MQLDHVAFMRKSDMRYWLIWFLKGVKMQFFGNFFPKPDLAFKAFAVYCGKLLRVKQGVVT